MRRLITFCVAMTLVCSVSLIPVKSISKPQERFARYAEVNLAAAANQLFIPGFRALKVRIQVQTPGIVSMTVYEPYTGNATDSFVVTGRGSIEYYGPVSDTVRVTSDSAATISAYGK